MAELLAAALFGAGYLAISLEHRLFINKAATSLILGVVLWILVGSVLGANGIQQFLVVAGADLFGIVIFLLASMVLVEILIHYHLFDILERWLRGRGWTLYQLGWAIATITFVLSSFLANLTTAIVAIQISRRLFPREYLLPLGALIVIASNAGGAWSPIGDITTLMLWFAHKFTATHVMLEGFLPSVVLTLISAALLLRRIPRIPCGQGTDTANNSFSPSRSDRTIMIVTLISFLLPLGTTLLGLPPYMGLLAGLGIVWLLIDVAKKARPQPTHLQASIQKFFQQSDIESIQFFVGILLSVAALHALGILDHMTDLMLGSTPSLERVVSAFAGLGLLSALVDNVPLTAAAISALENISSSLWVLLAITVGTGGSLLVIGSAAGVVAMGMIPEMSFGRYMKVATLPALAGFIAAIGVWLAQRAIFF